jgi:hypothetical protein
MRMCLFGYLLAGVVALASLGAQAQSTGDKLGVDRIMDLDFLAGGRGCLSTKAYCRLATSLGCLSKEGYLAYFKALKEAQDHGSGLERIALERSVKD